MLARSKPVPENHYENSSKPSPVQLPAIYFLYSEKDKKIKDEASFYFTSLKDQGLLATIQYFTMEEQPMNWWIDAIEKWDIFVLPVSIHLVTNPTYKQFLSRLKKEHQLKRIALIPILLGEAGINLGPYENVVVFPTCKKALKSGFWDTSDNFYLKVLGEIIPLIKEFTEMKAAHDNLWKEKKEANSIEGYHSFLKEFPFSRHAEVAKKRKKELEEVLLVEDLDQVELTVELYEYLVNTPLDQKRDEALDKIYAIETNEDLVWEDLKHEGQLEELLEFRMKFPNGKYQTELAQKIKEKISEEPDWETLFRRRSNTNLLRYLAITNLHCSELLSLETYLDYINYLEHWWEEELEPFKFYRKSVRFMLIFGLIIAIIGMYPTSYLIPKYIMMLPFIYYFARFLNGLYRQHRERSFFQRAKAHLKHFRTLLKIYYIIHDNQSVQKIKAQLNRLDEQATAMLKKTLKDYVNQNNPVEPFDFDKLLPKRHIN